MGDIVKLNACLNALGGVRLHTFTDRKVLQKRIYFLQEFGIDLGYHLGWYISGPYSSELTSDAFTLLQQKRQAPSTVENQVVSYEDLSAIKKLKEFLGRKDLIKNVEKSGYWLELLSSLHFIWKVSYLKEKKTRETITAKLKEQKKGRFNDEDIVAAWKLLEEFDLVHFEE